MADCIYNLRVTHLNFQACHQPKVVKFTEKMRNEGSVPTNNKQFPPLNFDPSFMKNVECAKYNEKNNNHIFRFKFFELS